MSCDCYYSYACQFQQLLLDIGDFFLLSELAFLLISILWLTFRLRLADVKTDVGPNILCFLTHQNGKKKENK